MSLVRIFKKQKKNSKGVGRVECIRVLEVVGNLGSECWNFGVLDLSVGVLELDSTVERALEIRIFGYQNIFFKKGGEGGRAATSP